MQITKPFFFGLIALLFVACTNTQPETTTTEEVVTEVEEVVVEEPKDLFAKLSTYCGKSYNGTFLESYDGPAFFKDKPLAINLEYCNDNEISIPFQVGEDKSKTWKLAKTEAGFTLKHDVTDNNGKLAKITNYGGAGTLNAEQPFKMEFPADEATQKMIPSAKDNVWHLDLDPENQVLTYTIKRGSSTRFKASFDMTKPL